jgi:hypothetical protein
MLAKTFENEMSNLMKVILEKQLVKNMCLVLKYQRFFGAKKIFLRRMLCNKNNFYKTLALWLSKITYLFNL